MTRFCRKTRIKYLNLYHQTTLLTWVFFQNHLQEAFVLFKSIMNSRWFSRTSIILFLNKMDVFQEKLPHSPLAKYFPEFTSGDDLQKATKFILWKFVNMNRAKLPLDRKSTRLNSSHQIISYAVFCLKKKTDHACDHLPCTYPFSLQNLRPR